MSDYPNSNRDNLADTATASKHDVANAAPTVEQDVAGTASAAISKAATSAHGAIKSTQDAASSALAALDDKVGQVMPAFQRAAAKLDSAAKAGLQTVGAAKDQAYKKAVSAKESAVGYVRREPAKGLLISAAIGAALALFMGWGKGSKSVKRDAYRND